MSRPATVLWACVALGLLGVACGEVSSSPDAGLPRDAGPPPPARIYASFVSHNEDDLNDLCASRLFGLSATPAGPSAGATVPPRDLYLAMRAATVELAQTIVEAGAAYDMQSDYPFLDAVDRYDDATVMASTGGQNLVSWLATFAPGSVTVDAHSHEHRYLGEPVSYADVAALVAELTGLPSTGVVGGFLAAPAGDEDWTRFRAGPVVALRVRSAGYAWSPGVLWGSGSPMHVADVDISGVWRPTDGDHFDVDDPASTLPNIGVWYPTEESARGLDDLLGRLHAGTLEAGHLYTVTIMSTHCDLDAARIAEVRSIVDAHAADVAAGDLVWATLPEVLRAWREDYGAVPTILHNAP